MAVIFPVRTSESLLSSIVERLRRLTMSDWIKIGLTLAGFAIITWSMVQQHEYRLGQIEAGFKEHLDKHDDQYRELQKSLREIDLTLTRLSTTNGR